MGKLNIHTNFRLHLSCTSDQANLVMSQPRGQRERFAVIAHVLPVSSTEEEVRYDEDGSSYSQAVVDISGRCVDLMFIGPYFGDYDEVFSTFRH